MKQSTIKIVANSLEKARKKGRAGIPKGFMFMSERVLSDGRPVTFTETAEKSKLAFAAAKAKVPAGAHIVAENEVQAPETVTLRLSAENEESARKSAESKMDKTSILQTVSLAVSGRKGFLGIGRTPAQYDVRILKKAIFEITYKTKAMIVFTVCEISEMIQHLCDTLAKATEPYKIVDIIKQLAATNDSTAIDPILSTINRFGGRGRDLNINSMLCSCAKALRKLNAHVRFVFQPWCFLCHSTIREIEVYTSLAQFGELVCPTCHEVYDYSIKEFDEDLYLHIKRSHLDPHDNRAVTNYYGPVRAELA